MPSIKSEKKTADCVIKSSVSSQQVKLLKMFSRITQQYVSAGVEQFHANLNCTDSSISNETVRCVSSQGESGSSCPGRLLVVLSTRPERFYSRQRDPTFTTVDPISVLASKNISEPALSRTFLFSSYRLIVTITLRHGRDSEWSTSDFLLVFEIFGAVIYLRFLSSLGSSALHSLNPNSSQLCNYTSTATYVIL